MLRAGITVSALLIASAPAALGVAPGAVEVRDEAGAVVATLTGLDAVQDAVSAVVMGRAPESRAWSVVAGTGELRLPALTFASAFEVRTKVTASPSSGSAVVRRQAGFYAECFGEVARATSGDNEESASFTTASEVRRFTP